jgi:glutathione synthase/RimK-type ligase-like ATP-grasp enzyme
VGFLAQLHNFLTCDFDVTVSFSGSGGPGGTFFLQPCHQVEALMNSPQQNSTKMRIPINVLFGLPDDGEALIHVTDDGKRLDFTLRGTASMVPFVSQQRFILSVLYLHPGQKVPIQLGAGPLLNHVGDADLCSGALALIEQITSKVLRPCFNPPAAIGRTTRDQVSRLLTGIPGLIVPKTIRTNASTPETVLAALEEAQLVFPVLVRIAGAHGGMEMVKVDRPADIDEVLKLKSRGRSLYVTEFRDFMSRDGRYRKSRIAVIGQDIFLRHHVVGEQWALHADDRAANTEEEEIAAFRSFDDEWAPGLRPIFREIANRLGLDFFGVDCNIDEDGQVLLFEANACMLILKNTRPSPNIWDDPIRRITTAVENLLASPENWRDFRRATSAAKDGGIQPERR